MENKKWLRTYVPAETHKCLLTESQSRGITIGELIDQLLVYNGLDELRDLPEPVVYGVAFERKEKDFSGLPLERHKETEQGPDGILRPNFKELKKKKEDYYDQLHNISQYIDVLLRLGDFGLPASARMDAQGIRSLAERIQKMIKL